MQCLQRFYCASLDDEALPKMGSALRGKERTCSEKSKFFPFRGDWKLKGRQSKKFRVASAKLSLASCTLSGDFLCARN